MKFIRLLFYIAILVIVVIAVQRQKTNILKKREVVPVSVLEILKEKGAPVKVYNVDYNSVLETLNVSLEDCGRSRCFSQSRTLSKNLSVGDGVYSLDGKRIGEVINVSSPNSFTGLVRAKVSLNEKAQQEKNKFSIVKIGVSETKDTLTIPTESISYNKDSAFVWVLNNGKPQKKDIKLGAQSDDIAQVKSGLKRGDSVIYEGQGLLQLYDQARVIKEKNKSRNLN